jgi:hypothetical protein
VARTIPGNTEVAEVNDDYGIGVFFQGPVELGLARLLNLEHGVTEPTGSISTAGRVVWTLEPRAC